MSEQLTGYLFLTILILFPVLMIASLIYLLIRHLRKKNNFFEITEKLGWNKLDFDAQEMKEWQEKLRSTLFSELKGQHTIKAAWKGNIREIPVFFSRYHYRSNSPYGELRKGGYYTLLAINKGNGKSCRLMSKYGSILTKTLEQVSNGYWAQIEKPWDWAYVSSLSDLQSMNFNSKDAHELQSLIKPGCFLFFYPDITIFFCKEEVDEVVLKDPKMIIEQLLDLVVLSN